MGKTKWIELVLLLSLTANAEVIIPEDHFVPGWVKSDSTLRFTKYDLTNYINGGAELFIEFGFDALWVQRYSNEDEAITLEVYRMESPEAALGIYRMKCGIETPVEGITATNSGNAIQFAVVKGSYFLQVNNFSGKDDLQSVMVTLVQTTLKQVPEDSPADVFKLLPKENLMPGSELLIRGPYALEPIFTFGKGDILQLHGKIFGVVGDYTGDNGQIYTRIIIQYLDRESALLAYQNLVENLDPYLEILERQEERFVFEDFQNKFGSVEVKDCTMEIFVNLSEKPFIKLDRESTEKHSD